MFGVVRLLGTIFAIHYASGENPYAIFELDKPGPPHILNVQYVRRFDGRHAPENGRRDLTDIAIDCFARYGYRATSIDRIAKAAGLTKGAIYYHFKDKEELLFAAVANRVEPVRAPRHQRDPAPVDDAVAALRRTTEVCLEHATKSNHRRFIVTLMVEALGTNARLSAQFREMMQRFRAFLRDIIERGQKQGVFRADVDAVAAAASLRRGGDGRRDPVLPGPGRSRPRGDPRDVSRPVSRFAAAKPA